MRYVSRSQWGARAPRSRSGMARSNGVYVHHSAGPETQSVKQIQNFHMDSRGWSDIAYSWLVDRNGTIYEGRGWGVAGAHTVGYNSSAHAVCYIGNTSAKAAPAAAKAAINTVIAEHNRRYGNGYVRPHNAVNSTACPGTDLTHWVNSGRPGGTSGCKAEGIRRGMNGFVVVGLQILLNKVANAKLAVDGDFGPATEKAVVNFNNFFKINGTECRAVATKKTLDTLKYLEAKKDGSVTPPPSPSAPVLKKGDNNYVVAGLQKMLAKVTGASLNVTGHFGDATKKAVVGFQKFFDMHRTDGVVDGKTLDFLKYLYDLKTKGEVDEVPPPVDETPEPDPDETDPPVVESTESILQKILALVNKLLRREESS